MPNLIKDKKYGYNTRVYWVLFGLTDFPKCHCCGKTIERNVFLNDYLSNTFGVFKLPAETETTQIISNNSVKPWYFNMNIPDKISTELKKLDVKGYFFVRQKRLATTLCQGFSLGIDRSGYVPALYHDNKYYVEGFLSNSKKPKLTADLKSREIIYLELVF